MGSVGKRKAVGVLIIVENLPVPFDRRVWQEARTLSSAGYQVSVICPKGNGFEKSRETIDGIEIYRHPLPFEADGALGYLLEYSWAFACELFLALRIFLSKGFSVIHACNPPDNIFLIGLLFKLFKTRFIFDHHDVNPELFEAKFGKRGGFLYGVTVFLERLSFAVADVCIATNESYRAIAVERGGVNPAKVFVVRSGPKLERLRKGPPVQELKNGRRYLVGYVGVMGKQEGIDYLLRAVRHLVYGLGRDDIQFGIVGGGTELQSLQAYAGRLGVSNYVTFTGRVSDSKLLEFLNTADVCVNPDVANAMNDKSTMNKIMEYMSLGKPIVQFDLREGRYSAQDASLYARKNDARDMADKIVGLLDNSQLRARMGEYGRKRVLDQLEWRHEEPKLLRAYSVALGRTG